ncbi:reverse transcriptase domain-containing protein [Tanacetum coccineum]
MVFMGRISFARALIEISSDRELKEELVVVIHVLDGTGYTKETIIVEYEWKPPHCVDCKNFGHSHEHCRKRVKEPEVVAMENQDDKFIEVIRKKNKGEKEDNSQPGHINGLKLNKPKPKYFYRLKEKKSHDKETNKDEEMNIVKLKNHFDALSQHEAIFRETGGNDRIVRRTLWHDLGLHKLVVRGKPWILMGDFNAALNLEDSYYGSYLMNNAMRDFKNVLRTLKSWILIARAFIIRGIRNQRVISGHSLAVLKSPKLAATKPKSFKNFKILTHKGVQETKMTRLELFRLKSMWGNYTFDYACSLARGSSGDGDFFMVNIYGPQDSSAKSSLWSRIRDFMHHHVGNYILFGDLNEVREESERYEDEQVGSFSRVRKSFG